MSPTAHRETLHVVVLADTHLRTGGALPPAVTDACRAADLILHAGDVLTAGVLDDLRDLAPVHAVLGNNDHDLRGALPDRLELDLAGVAVAMVHDAGPRVGRPARLRRWFPGAALVVFGHSHEPVDDEGIDGQRLFNPGSPTQRRRQPFPTLGRLDLAAGRVVHHEIVPVETRT